MLTTLIEQTKTLPDQIENLIQGLTESKQSLYDAILGSALAALVLCPGQEALDAGKEALDNQPAAAGAKEALAPSSDLKDLLTIKAKVLEARPSRSEGTIRAYVQTETGKEVIYAKNGLGKRLAASIGEKVTVKAKQLDKGWYAVAVNE